MRAALISFFNSFAGFWRWKRLTVGRGRGAGQGQGQGKTVAIVVDIVISGRKLTGR